MVVLRCSRDGNRSVGCTFGREAAAEGEEAAALSALAGQLTAAREGLRPVGAEELEAAAARLGGDSAAAESRSPDSQGETSGDGARVTLAVRSMWCFIEAWTHSGVSVLGA